MNMGERIKEMRQKAGLTQGELAQKLGLQKSAIAKYENGRVTNIKRTTIQKMSEIFNCTPSYLMAIDASKQEQNFNPTLTAKDEKDIAKKLTETLEQLENSQDALMFDGEPLSDKDKELLRISLENSMRIGKEMAKQKFTPKKYR